MKDFKALRKKTLGAKYATDENLIKIIEGNKNYNFLINPTGQNVFNYLTNLVKIYSESYFDKPFDSLKVLDWGTGKGQVTYMLTKLGGKITSCDIDSTADDSTFGQEVPIIKSELIQVLPLKHDYILPFEDNSFDVVLSFGVLEHVPNDQESLKELNRVLKPNGLIFCFNLPYTYSWTQKLAHMRGNFYHDRLYSEKHTKDLLKNSNFEVIEMWHRQLLPKNNVNYPFFRFIESIDQFLTNNTPLKYFATNIEFIATKKQIS